MKAYIATIIGLWIGTVSAITLRELSPRLTPLEPDQSVPEDVRRTQQLEYYTLNLSGKGLTDVTGIKDLRINYKGSTNFQLKNIPNLRLKIDLSHNELNGLPDELRDLGITHLNVSSNRLKEIPTVIRELAPTLVDLDLSHNAIVTVPPALSLVEKLLGLNLSHNSIEQLPQVPWYPRHLKNFDIRHNLLETIPSTIGGGQNLVRFYAAHNRLKDVAKELAEHTDLVEVDLSYNNLTTIPDSFASLTNIQRLHLNNNNINALPVSLAKLRNLTFLSLDANPIIANIESLNTNPEFYNFLKKFTPAPWKSSTLGPRPATPVRSIDRASKDNAFRGRASKDQSPGRSSGSGIRSRANARPQPNGAPSSDSSATSSASEAAAAAAAV